MSNVEAPIESRDVVSLWRRLVLVTIGAVALTMLFVLPAEYGADPTGAGKALGLTQLSTHDDENLSVVTAAATQNRALEFATITIEIDDLGEVEYKTDLNEGAALVYSWRVKGPSKNGGVYFDFHGHPPITEEGPLPDDFATSYATGEAPSGAGVLRAPFDGQHGWYFLNLEEGPLTVELTIGGFYGGHSEVHRAVQGEIVER